MHLAVLWNQHRLHLSGPDRKLYDVFPARPGVRRLLDRVHRETGMGLQRPPDKIA